MFFLIVLASCSDDDPTPETPVKSGSNMITAFKFAALTPEVVGTVLVSSKTITATVLHGTDLTKLVPTVTISDKATVTPASGVAQDFTAPVKYTVTAEDGSKQDYTVTITESAATFTATSFVISTAEQKGNIGVRGTHFGTYDQVKIVMTKTLTGATVEIKASQFSTATLLAFSVPADMPLGDYSGSVYVGGEAAVVPGKITILAPTPDVTAIDKTSVIPGDVITLTGTDFAASGNIIKISKSGSGTAITLSIVSESTTEIKVKIPASIAEGVYLLVITANGDDIYLNGKEITVGPDPNKPVITSLDQSSYARGETITMTGTGLGKSGVLTYINFMPWPNGGTTLLRNGKPNTEGTQLTFTIPGDFPTGTYEIVVEVDGNFSESYRDIVQITAN